MEKLRVAGVQIEHKAGDKDYNLGSIEYYTRKAAAEGVSVIAFPECCISSYMYLAGLDRGELVDLADEVPGSGTVEMLCRLAASEKITIMAGLLEKEKSVEGEYELFNTYVSVSADGSIVKYRKLHPFVNEHLRPGGEFKFWEIEGWKASCLICYDCNIPENWRVLQLNGAQVVFCPHQTGGFDVPCAGMGKISQELWRNRYTAPGPVRSEILGPKGREWVGKWLPGRAYDFGTYVVFCNGVGIDGDEVRTGNSMILDPHGIILAETNALGDDMVIADLDPAKLGNNLGRSHAVARRPELYRPLTEHKAEQIDTREERTRLRRELGAELTDIQE
ncbi:MAG: nitrilase-related carbon-nitrogen hydrolase [Gemmatimonadota bacterium]|nr:nitrilase-related carbon-nitrogen hydrolase [Gemmatimonadota bacterium]